MKRNYGRFRESDSFDSPRYDTDGSFSHPNFSFERRSQKKIGRFEGPNRFGESHIQHDSYQDDQFKDDFDPTYQDEYGMRHPYEHGGTLNRWSDDIRSEASHEDHSGKGPKGYKRSDEKIREEACEILTRSREIDASDIEVEVKEACLYLKGEVGTRSNKRLAEELLENIPGLTDIQNQIQIKNKYAGHDQRNLV